MTRPPSAFVHLNGHLVPAARARVSALDRGLLYADGLFETLRTYRGAMFALDDHLARLRTSAAVLKIRIPRRAWRRDIAQLLIRNRLADTDAAVRITITRGSGGLGLVSHAVRQPTVIITASPIAPSVARQQRQGIRAVILPFVRQGLFAELKTLDYLPAVMGKMYAKQHGASEGLFVDARGRITEGTTSNLFVWRRGQLITPPPVGVLPGITRRLLIATARGAGIRVTERPVPRRDLFEADGAFVTSSVVEVVPVTHVDQTAIGNGRVGAQTRQLQALYRQLVDRTLSN